MRTCPAPAIDYDSIGQVRLYKLADGKSENTLDLDGEAKGTNFAREIVRTAHEGWRKVVTDTASSTFVDL